MSIPPLLCPDGSYTSPEESARLLLRAQIRQDDPASDSEDHVRERALLSSPYPDVPNDVEFTDLEVASMVRSIKLRSASGLDRMTPSMVQSFFRVHPSFFLFLFNSALRLGYFPTVRKQGRVVFLPNPGRPPESAMSYRPICMNSVSGKVLERLLNSRLYYFLVRNNLLHPSQFGFTHSKSTTATLYSLKSVLRDRRKKLLHSVLILLDFQGAFDSVWHPIVLNFFRKHSCPTNPYRLLESFLSNRRVVLRTCSEGVSIPATVGSPQGSPLSPMLWNILIHGLLETSFPTGVYVQAYADDSVLVVSGTERREIEALADSALRIVAEWADRVKVRLNADKCCYILFPNRCVSMARRLPTIRLGAVSLKKVSEIKLLGVIFDPWFTSIPHVNYPKTKVEVTTQKLQRFLYMHCRTYAFPA